MLGDAWLCTSACHAEHQVGSIPISTAYGLLWKCTTVSDIKQSRIQRGPPRCIEPTWCRNLAVTHVKLGVRTPYTPLYFAVGFLLRGFGLTKIDGLVQISISASKPEDCGITYKPSSVTSTQSISTRLWCNG